MTTTLLETTPIMTTPITTTSNRAIWAGRIISGIVALLLLMDLSMKLIGAKEAIDGTVQLGYQAHHVAIIGAIQLACLILYLIPRTAPLGAILWTGYFGGAVATHLRIDNPLFTHILSGVYVSALLWGGLYLRDPRVRALFRAER